MLKMISQFAILVKEVKKEGDAEFKV